MAVFIELQMRIGCGWRLILGMFFIGYSLGAGTFAEVKKAIEIDTGETRAIKVSA